MAIRGGLAEFSVEELLQLLNIQQKTGVLVLSESQGTGYPLFFERGRLLAAADRRESGRHAFLNYLETSLLVTRDQVESIEDICNATGNDIFGVILTSGIMGRDRLMEEMRRYSQRIIDEVVVWHEGTYEFSGDEKSLPPQGLQLKLNPEELLLESMRRRDELATLKQSMLAPDLVLAPVGGSSTEPLPRECTLVFGFVNGGRNISEICRLSPLGDYDTYEAISELLGRQRIMIVDPEEAASNGFGRGSGLRLSWPAMAAVVSFVLGSALLGIGLSPILERTRVAESWLDDEVQARRVAAREHLEMRVNDLMLTLDTGDSPD